jgi:uncharacterized protein with HEPN domain
MSKRDDFLLLEDMIESSDKILSYTSGYNLAEFLNDPKTIDAVVRNFEIIGEAANRIDAEFKSNHSQVEWNKLRGFRNRLVHEYFGVDYQILWEIIENELPILIELLKSIKK